VNELSPQSLINLPKFSNAKGQSVEKNESFAFRRFAALKISKNLDLDFEN
jgi:hypothetical protein